MQLHRTILLAMIACLAGCDAVVGLTATPGVDAGQPDELAGKPKPGALRSLPPIISEIIKEKLSSPSPSPSPVPSPSPTLIPQACSDKLLCWSPLEDDGYEVRQYAQPSAYVDLTLATTFSTQGLITDFAPAQVVLKPGQRTLVGKFHRPTRNAAAWVSIPSARAQYGDYTVTSDSYIYGIPWRVGESYKVGNGWNQNGAHVGDMGYAVDFLMPISTPVLAARDGVVFAVESSFSKGGNDPSLGDKANYVFIRHENGTYGRYLHFKQGGVAVVVGQPVKRGQLIGYSGMVGWATDPHLHFDVATAKDASAMHTLPAKMFLHANHPEGEQPLYNQTYTAF